MPLASKRNNCVSKTVLPVVLAYAPRRPAGEAYRALWLELLGRLIPRQE